VRRSGQIRSGRLVVESNVDPWLEVVEDVGGGRDWWEFGDRVVALFIKYRLGEEAGLRRR